MAMINDRDLLLVDEEVFRDAISAATVLVSTGDGSVEATTLTSAGADFASPDIDIGCVVLVDDEVSEVVERLSATELTISRRRRSTEDALIPPTAGTNLAVKVPTFTPEIERVELAVLSSLGGSEQEPAAPLQATAILNQADVAAVIALQALARVYQAAAASDGTDQTLFDRAALFEARADAARRGTQAVLDLDGDGIADATRRLDVVVLSRL
jgi:hypothetical protein